MMKVPARIAQGLSLQWKKRIAGKDGMTVGAGIWVRLMHKNRIARDTTVECSHASWQSALEEACHKLDVGRPMVLPRHERDWDQFSQARFLKEHFIEDVPFDRMEVEFIDPEKKKKKNDPYASFL